MLNKIKDKIGVFMRPAVSIFIAFAVYIWIIVNRKRKQKLHLVKTHNLIYIQPENYMGLQEDMSKFLLIVKSNADTTYHYWYVLSYGGVLHREVSADHNVGIHVIKTDTTPKVEVWHNAAGYTEYRFMIPKGGSSVIKDDSNYQV